jgi:type I restriction enzyme S subunit
MDILKNIPSLRFPEFDGEWNSNDLGNIFKISAGGDIGIENVSQVKNDKFKYPIYANAEKRKGLYGYSNIYKIEENVITVAGRGVNIGIAHARDHKFYPIVRLLVLRPKNQENIYFFEYQINRLDLYKESTGVPQLTAPQVSGYIVKFPMIQEQTKIAYFLTSVDDKLTALKQKKTLLEQYKKGVMQKIFSQELRFKDDNGNDYPNWEEKKLGDIGETYNGLTGKSKEHFGDGKPYIQYKQIFDDSKIDISRFELVKISSTENQNKVVFGDVFFTVSSETPNEIGTASVLLDDIQELYLNSFCFGYRASNLCLSPYFSRYLFRNELFRNQILKLAQGSTRFNMSKVQLMKLIVKLPCLEEQTKIANYLSAIDDKINNCQSQIEKTEVWKKGLLQQMFV